MLHMVARTFVRDLDSQDQPALSESSALKTSYKKAIAFKKLAFLAQAKTKAHVPRAVIKKRATYIDDNDNICLF